MQHAHIEKIKTEANLINNKDVLMCIMRFHARADYLQHYELSVQRRLVGVRKLMEHRRNGECVTVCLMSVPILDISFNCEKTH